MYIGNSYIDNRQFREWQRTSQMPSNRRLRNVVFTINNYVEGHISALESFAASHCTYMVFGKEIGDEKKTPHLQGYCELKKQTSFKKIKEMAEFKTAHIESRKGTAKQAADYCKKDGDFKEIGTISSQGKRADLSMIPKLVKAGKTDLEILELHPSLYMRHYKAISRVRNMYERADKKFDNMDVRVYLGKPGIGKTRKAHEEFPDIFTVPSVDPLWMDGYDGESAVLLDDFYGGMKWETLLNFLDGYKRNYPIKGGMVYKRWTTVIITSNAPMETWYPHRAEISALRRRVHKIVDFDETEAETDVE